MKFVWCRRLAGTALALGACLLASAPGHAAKPTGSGAAGTPSKFAPATFLTPAEIHKTIGKQKGRVVVLHLWASWCLPCLDELPLMAKFAREMKSKGVEVVSISLDDPTPYAQEKVGRLISEKAGNGLLNVIARVEDPEAFMTGIDPRWEGNIPALFFYGRDSRLRRAYVGEATREDLDQYVADLLGPAPPAR